MNANPGQKPSDADPRNKLARIRTELANERTLLSYGRTALGFAIAGASSMRFLDGDPAYLVGAPLLALAAAGALIGIKRFLAVRARIARIPLDPRLGEDDDFENRIRG